jgi:hypothetical protein
MTTLLERAPISQREVVPVQAASIQPRMRVYDTRGGFLGSVKEVGDADFLVGRRWRAELRLPITRVVAVMGQAVHVDRRPE